MEICRGSSASWWEKNPTLPTQPPAVQSEEQQQKKNVSLCHKQLRATPSVGHSIQKTRSCLPWSSSAQTGIILFRIVYWNAISVHCMIWIQPLSTMASVIPKDIRNPIGHCTQCFYIILKLISDIDALPARHGYEPQKYCSVHEP